MFSNELKIVKHAVDEIGIVKFAALIPTTKRRRKVCHMFRPGFKISCEGVSNHTGISKNHTATILSKLVISGFLSVEKRSFNGSRIKNAFSLAITFDLATLITHYSLQEILSDLESVGISKADQEKASVILPPDHSPKYEPISVDLAQRAGMLLKNNISKETREILIEIRKRNNSYFFYSHVSPGAIVSLAENI